MADYVDIVRLVAQEASSHLGDKPRYWQWGTTPLPRGGYRKCVILVVGDYSKAMLAAMPAEFERMARESGFRLLKVQMATPKPILLGGVLEGRLFTGYAASDTWQQTVGALETALQGAPIVIDSEPVGLVEKNTLDALWIASEATPQVEHDIAVDIWPIVGGAVAIMTSAALIWVAVRKKGR